MAIINISAGPTNAVEVCTEIFNVPTLEKLLEEFEADETNNAISA